jgi:FkbM family methyltransferase
MSFFKNDTIISRSLRESGEWAEGEIDLLCHLINSGDTVLDIGAFIGTHTLAFSRKVGGAGTVYAFEPQPSFFEVLRKNTEQNALTNVRALSLAVADRDGRAEIREIDTNDTCNFGQASVSAASDGVLRCIVELITVDQLALNRCDLIKIDAEDMEINVLRGAQQTLRSMRPFVSAECNSLEYGWSVVEFFKNKQYYTFILNAPSYNSANFRQDARNFLGDGRETSLILVPAEKLPLIQSYLAPTGCPPLIPISCIDDLALALLKRPQYKHEIMSKGIAATVLGVDFWANESELMRFQQTIQSYQSTVAEGIEERSRLTALKEELTQQLVALQSQSVDREQRAMSLSAQLTALEAQLAEREQNTAELSKQLVALEAQLAEREQNTEELSKQLVALQAQLAEREQNTAELSKQLVALQAQLMKREQNTADLSEQLVALQAQLAEQEATFKALLTSTSWRLTEPLRRLKQIIVECSRIAALVRERVSSPNLLKPLASPTSDDELLYSIDSLSIEAGRVRGFGWAFHHNQKLASVTLVARVPGNEHRIPACYGSNREDVVRAHPCTNAQGCGFSLAGRLPFEAPSEIFFQVETETGEIMLAPVSAEHVCQHSPTSDDELLYSIDSLSIKAGRVHSFGWAFHKNQKLASVTLVARVPGNEHRIPACYGSNREDVVRAHPCTNAQGCGFSLAGKLPFEAPSEIFFEVETETGEIMLAPVSAEHVRQHRKGGSPTEPSIEEVLDVTEKPSNDDALSSMDDGRFKAHTPVGLQSFLCAARNSFDRQFVLLLDHNLGGGANQFRRELVRTILDNNRPILLLWYDLPRQDYMIDYIDLECEFRFRLDTPVSLLTIAEKLTFEEIFLNNVYSFEDTLAIAELLPTLKKITRAKLTVAIHDYLPICPSFTLIDHTGKFCGVPDLSRCEHCLPCHTGEFSHLIDQRGISVWRHTWSYCLSEADTILCFSDVSVGLVSRAYPELDRAKFVVRPHQVKYLPERKPCIDSAADINIGVVGHISVHKGALVVADLAAFIEQQHLAARITLIGTISPKPNSDVITVTGAYQVEELPNLIEKHRVNLFLFPSICPETFSYVCQELMQLEVPLAVYDFSAAAERVTRYGRGLILHGTDAEATMKSLIAFHEKLRQEDKSTYLNNDLERGDMKMPQILTRAKGGNHKVHVFTGVALDHIHRASILCESLKHYHPDFAFHVALADKVPSWLELSNHPFDSVIGIESLDIPNLKGWIFSHGITELCTAIKPFVLRRLLELDGCQQVYFFDSDIVLFSRIDDLVSILDNSTLVLTPHQTTPESTLEAVMDNEICSLKHGIYNLGFLGVRNTPEARRFADWWADRLYYFCRESLDMHLWTDQKWINHVPVFFEQVQVVKSPRFNVAPWNITTRKLEGSFETGFTVNGEPLGFYHFTGFDSGAHKIMTTKYASGNPTVESLIRWYERANQSDRGGRAGSVPWAYDTFENGEPVTKLHRSIYRLRPDLQEAYPDPFEVKPGKSSYHDWFRWRAAIEHPELFSRPSSVSVETDLISEDHELRYLLDVINTLNSPRGLLTSFARFLLLAERYRFLTWFHYRRYGLKQVLELAHKRTLRVTSASSKP